MRSPSFLIGLGTILLIACGACGGGNTAATTAPTAAPPTDATSGATPDAAMSFPLVLVGDVPLTGAANRFDYQDVDVKRGHLVIAHMNDASVVIADLKDGAVLKTLPNVPTARGVAVADEIARIFVTSSPNQIVVIDADSLSEVARLTTGRGPDGIAWDGVHHVVASSDQADGAISLLASDGTGTRTPVKLGTETGNVVFDETRGTFWITVVGGATVDRLMEIDPTTGAKKTTIELPGCDAAHGLRIHPDGKSALVACEGNSKLARVDLGGAHAIVLAKTGNGPDVLAVDAPAGLLYVAAESGDLAVFDITKAGLEAVDREHPGDSAHTVAVDPATHRVFFPLASGPDGKPALRIMRPGP